MTSRDWKWTVSVLIGLIVLLLTYNLWGKQDSIIDVISIGSGITSIVLAILAIIMSLFEGFKTHFREKKLDENISKLENNLISMENIIVEGNNSTHNKIEDMVKMYKDFEGSPASKAIYNEQIKDEEKQDVNNKSEEGKVGTFPIKQAKKKDRNKVFEPEIKQGDIFQLDSRVSDDGNSYYLVISNDTSNKYSRSVGVVKLTNQIKEGSLPTHVLIERSILKTEMDYFAACEIIRTISRRRLVNKVADLDKFKMKQIMIALKIYLGFFKTS
ncbi:type II toxin-antitoxin system PemK/MazF family toxin [Bacillus altitudinis]|uniref:type II toxin-antitoxin system PemK/MazF family toxin n=1 Tax=Bacillus altitudinis TaxID=293387 RepID=UPI0022474634|nr:type II toxin-antitoxin system PemK/MazF family toxin [Bacillus altitudinis]KAJ0073374.1 type II toxin-antitoxin system PemK/MazF family toxin [Bacillus altitudinis]